MEQNGERKIDAVPASVFRFWDQKDLKEMLFSCIKSNLFFMTSNCSLACSVNKHQGIIQLMLAMLKVRYSSQNKTEARKLLDFCIKEKDGSIRGVNSLEEFVKVVKELEIPFEIFFLDSLNENEFLDLSAVSKVQCYLNKAYKYD